MAIRDEVSVWLTRADSTSDLSALIAVLSEEELARAASLIDPADQRRYVTAHGAARFIIGAAVGLAPQHIDWIRGINGKPAVAGVHISLSHSADLSLVAICTTRPVGVDIQEVLPSLDVTGLAGRFFLPAEAAAITAEPSPDLRADLFAQLWTRKEAVIKAKGGRLMQGLRIPVQGRRMVVTGYPDGTEAAAAHRVTDIAAPAGFRAAVALAGREDYHVQTHLWIQRTEISAVER